MPESVESSAPPWAVPRFLVPHTSPPSCVVLWAEPGPLSHAPCASHPPTPLQEISGQGVEGHHEHRGKHLKRRRGGCSLGSEPVCMCGEQGGKWSAGRTGICSPHSSSKFSCSRNSFVKKLVKINCISEASSGAGEWKDTLGADMVHTRISCSGVIARHSEGGLGRVQTVHWTAFLTPVFSTFLHALQLDFCSS